MADPNATDDGDRERLQRLAERLDLAAERAEQLLSESVRAAAPGRPPAAGWQRADDSGERRAGWLAPDELELLLTVLAGIRDRIPPELRERLADAVRELLTAVRALIDWYLERIERRPRGPSEVHDIPII